MKALVIGIFGIIVLGFMFFVYQFIKSADFTDVTNVKNSTISQQKEVYIDLNRNSSFEYPKGWVMYDPAKAPGFAPVFRNSINLENTDKGESGIGFIAFGIESLDKNKTIAEDIELYSSELPINNILNKLIIDNMGEALSSESDAQIELSIEEVKRVTYKSGLSGFTVKYSGLNQSVQVNGKVYFYYTLNGIEFSFSTYIESVQVENSTGDTDTKEQKSLKSSSQLFLDQAQEALINIVQY